ncbi:hypothetical protein PINS_up006356 [Pythium insidiosum]|nr:hypothetical protein PINS_up006356 [Pythium insidiosum]
MFPNMLAIMLIGNIDPENSALILAGYGQSDVIQGIIANVLLGAVVGSLSTLCSQAYGGKRYQEMWMFIQASMLMFLAALPALMTALLFGERMLLAMGQDAAIAAVAGKLFRLQLVQMPLDAVFMMLQMVLQAQNITRPLLPATIVAWSICLPLAYFLGSTLSLGYMGVSAALALTAGIKFLVMLPALRSTDEFLTTWPGWKLKEAAQLVPRVLKLSLPMAFLLTFQTLDFSVMSLMAGLLPNPAVMVTADSIYMATISMAFLAPSAIMMVGIVRIGNALGAGQAKRASLASRVVIGMCVGAATIGMLVLIPVSPKFARTVTPDEEAIKVAMHIFRSLIVLIPLMGLSFGLLSVFIAAGKQMLSAKLSFLLQFGVGMPLAYVAAMHLHGGLLGVWIGNLMGTIVFVIASVTWWMNVSWSKLAHEAHMNTHLHLNDAQAEPEPVV